MANEHERKDQAHTLRRMMLQRGEPAADSRGVGSVRLISLTDATSRGGGDVISGNLAAWFASAGLRTLWVDATTQETIHTATIPGHARRVRENLWVADREGESGSVARGPCADRAPDLVLVDTKSKIGAEGAGYHGSDRSSVVIMAPDKYSITEVYKFIKLLRVRSGVTRVSVVVNHVTDPSEARRAFLAIQDVTSRFIDVDLGYLGHWVSDEKVHESVMKRKFLIDLNSEASSARRLGLIGKQLLERMDGGASGRFKDEPARPAPGKIAELWRALLGEVKA